MDAIDDVQEDEVTLELQHFVVVSMSGKGNKGIKNNLLSTPKSTLVNHSYIENKFSN